MGGYGGLQQSRGQFAVGGGHGDALVAGGLNGPGLVDADVAGGGGDHRLVGPQKGSDGGEVGLGASHQKMHRRTGGGAEGADDVGGPGGVGVGAVAEVALGVGGGNGLQNGRMGGFGIVVGKAVHRRSPHRKK